MLQRSRFASWFALVALGVAMVGCSVDIGIDGDDDIGTSESTDASDSSSSESESSSSSESTDTSDTSESDTGTSTDATDTSDSTDSTDSGTGTDSTDSGTDSTDSSTESDTDTDTTDDGVLEEITYTAEVFIGAIDRVWIYRLDPFENTCAKLSVRHDFSPMQQFGVTTPMDWSVEYVWIADGLDCMGPLLGDATAGSGFVQFNDYDPMQDIFPCDVDVDAQFDMDTNPPTMLDFVATGLVPEGADCP